MAGFVLGGEVAGSGEGFGAVLRGEEALQGERLLDAQAGELVAGLGDFEGAGGISGAGHGVAEQARVGIDAVGDLTLQEGGTFETGVLLVPSAFGVAQYVIGRERRWRPVREQLLVAVLGCLQPQGDPFAGAKLGLDVAERALQVR